MALHKTEFSNMRPVGYAELIGRYDLKVMPHYCRSYIAPKGPRKTIIELGQIIEIYRKQQEPPKGLGDHLEFALKHEGINLEILDAVFPMIDPKELADFIRRKPTGKHTRRIWFLYEFLTEEKLDIENLRSSVRFVELLVEKDYFGAKRIPSVRHRVHNNLLGDRRFCPTIRKTDRIQDFIEARLDRRCREALKEFPDDVLKRALDYLFTKETKSSFEIEHIAPDKKRIARFVNLLKRAGTEPYLSKDALISLQQATVDERFANRDYRTIQNYVGMTMGLGRDVMVHYVSPKPEDLGDLMDGLLASAQRMLESKIHPVLAAGAVSFAFVFMHPFDDGNGRLHRFLLHHVLSQTGFTPKGLIFPVSAAMVNQMPRYDEMLESFSKPLMDLVDYEMNDSGEMTVLNETARHYRYPDMTFIVERLFEFIQETIETELVGEMHFLVSYDKAKQSIQKIVDMPDKLIDLFIRLCHQNQGRLSKKKRAQQFSMLTDEEIAQLEDCVKNAF